MMVQLTDATDDQPIFVNPQNVWYVMDGPDDGAMIVFAKPGDEDDEDWFMQVNETPAQVAEALGEALRAQQ